MKRLIDYCFNDAISAAMTLIPFNIKRRVEYADFFCGADPVFAGLHKYLNSSDGRSYSKIAHVIYPIHQAHLLLEHRVTTVVMPLPEEPWVICHELGHVLDEVTGFIHTAIPVTIYAKTNRREAFAEAFTAWLGCYGEETKICVDATTNALFDSLARSNNKNER